ncbi:MAG: glycosyltransferase [Chloroflexi bacterium]|nr:glycosyltransferase [Chloroflexota bacterium]MBV9544548.1 glycosyltransferase [Chloroflexota bacterium]
MDLFLAVLSLLLSIQSAYSTILMLYVWDDRLKSRRNHAPRTFESPRQRFTLLLPARHEEEVIQETIQRVVDFRYPRELVQVLVIIEAGDGGTIAKVREKLAALRRQGVDNVRLLIFSSPPINKPHGLNVGLRAATGNIVTIFDSEDEPHPDLLNVVNTVVTREGVERAPVIQCGVQLMNYADRWFSALNVLEYFFWFRSRMHYHAAMGMVPLGGNTVFMRRELLNRLGGWDEACLTEDADIGIRLSAQRVPIRVIYDDRYVTREETPPSVSQFVKQRTRWDQGFLQVLGKRDWLRLPNPTQSMLALYTLAFPLVQALTLVYIPASLWMMLFAKVPVPLAMLSSLPLYMLIIQLLIAVLGLHEFTSLHGLRAGPVDIFRLVIAYFPYQVLLGFAAFRAVWRQALGQRGWEKTAHVGAHRVASARNAHGLT